MFHSVACCCPSLVCNVEVSCAWPTAMFRRCQLDQRGSVSYSEVARTWNVRGIKRAPKGGGATGHRSSQQIAVKRNLVDRMIPNVLSI